MLAPAPAPATEADERSRDTELAPLFPLGAAAALFGVCVAAGPHLFDAGELAAAAADLGGSHPPGQPLHALLGYAVALVPLGPIPARLALLSAVCALAAGWVVARICGELCDELELHRGVRAIAQVVAVFAVLGAPPVLRQALRIEVYTLALLLFLLSARELLGWARSARAAPLAAAALFAGLAACVHPPHALAAALTGACLGSLQLRRLLLQRPRAVPLAFAFGLLGLLTLVYLPVRARAGASMWGDPQTIAGFWRYVSGQAFFGKMADADRLSIIAGYAGYLLRITLGVPFVGALLLLSPRVARSSRVVHGFVLAAGAALIAACLAPLEERNPDNVAYLAPALSLAILLGCTGFAAVFRASDRSWRLMAAACGLAFVMLPPLSSAGSRAALRSDLPALETLEGILVEAPPPRAFVVSTTDFVGAGWMQTQSIDRARPDVAPFVSGLSTSSWQWARLARHPGLDPRPRRAPGRDAHDSYTRGAILSALPRVPVLLENDLPGMRASAIAGAYALVDPRHPPDAERQRRSMAERWLATLERDARRGPSGDSGAADAIVRKVFHQRSQRLFALLRSGEALAGAAQALWDLPPGERALVRVPPGASPVAPMPLVAVDPRAFLVSREDSVRLAAAELWALAAREPARQLLARQAERGDPRALLQLAQLQAFDGDGQAALRSLQDFDVAAPELQSEGLALRAALAR